MIKEEVNMAKIGKRSLSEEERKEYNRIIKKELFGLEVTKEEERLQMKGDAELKRQNHINTIR
jgi:hypothetical protein